jgi:hypothetical protein
MTDWGLQSDGFIPDDLSPDEYADPSAFFGAGAYGHAELAPADPPAGEVDQGGTDAVAYDSDGDGQTDVLLADENHDGQVDAAMWDTNHDGLIDQVAYDQDHDGKIDLIYHDDDYDGQVDRVETASGDLPGYASN